MKRLWINDKDYIILNEKNSLSEELATRRRSIDYYGLLLYLPNPDPVLKKLGRDLTAYEELLGDARVSGCVSSRKAGVKSLEWDIDRGKAKSRQGKVIISLFKNDLDFYQVISESLDAVLYGYSVLEVVWEKTGPYILPRRIQAKPHNWFIFDHEGNLKLRTIDNPVYGEPLPEYKFLLVQHNATYKNPYGEPVLSKCFWPVTFKRGGMKFWLIFSEKYGMPFLIGKHPRGTSEKETEKLADILEQMVQDAVAVIPDDSSVEIMEAGGKSASSAVYRELLEYCDQEISIALLGQNLTTEVKGGSYAATQSHMKVRQDLIDSDRKLIEKTFNRLIKWIYELNFGDGEMPQFVMYEEEDIDKELADRDEKLGNVLQLSGLKFSKQYFQKAYGLEEEDFEEPQPTTTNPPNQQFSEPPDKNPFPDQQAIDDAVNALSPEELQKQMEGVLKPIIDLINESNDYSKVMEKLVETFPDMDTKTIEDMLTRGIFVSELWGMLNASKN